MIEHTLGCVQPFKFPTAKMTHKHQTQQFDTNARGEPTVGIQIPQMQNPRLPENVQLIEIPRPAFAGIIKPSESITTSIALKYAADEYV